MGVLSNLSLVSGDFPIIFTWRFTNLALQLFLSQNPQRTAGTPCHECTGRITRRARRAAAGKERSRGTTYII